MRDLDPSVGVLMHGQRVAGANHQIAARARRRQPPRHFVVVWSAPSGSGPSASISPIWRANTIPSAPTTSVATLPSRSPK